MNLKNASTNSFREESHVAEVKASHEMMFAA